MMTTGDIYYKQNTYKIIAILLMFLDHVGALFNIIGFRIFGHICIMLFLYSYVHGLSLSKGLNIKKLIKLAAIGLIAQPFYIYLFDSKALNIFFLYLLYYIFKYIESNNKYINFIQFLMFCSLTFILNIEYWFFGFSVLYVYDKVKNIKIQNCLNLALNIIFIIYAYYVYDTMIFILQPFTLLLIHEINKGSFTIKYPVHKNVFYLFYPTHLFLLCIIKYFL
jgi:hypothetical protein